MSATSSSAWSLAGQIVMSGAKFLTLVLIARGLSVSDQGHFALSIAFAQVVSTLGTLGLDLAHTVFAQRERQAVPAMVGGSLLVAAALFTLLLLAFLGARTAGFDWIATTGVVLVPAIAACSALSLLLGGCLAGLQNFRALFLSHLLRFGPTTAGVVLLNEVLTLRMSLTIWLGGLGIGTGFAFILLLHETRGRVEARADVFAPMMFFGLKGQMDRVANLLTYRLDLFLVGVVRGSDAAGLYSVAQQAAEFLLLVPRAVHPVILSSKRSELQGQAPLPPFVVAGVVGAVMGGALVVGLFADTLIPMVFSSSYAEAATPARVLLVGVVVMSLGILFAARLMSDGRPELTAVAGLVALLVTIGLDLLLIPRWGVLGAAVASAAAYTSYTIVITVAALQMKPPPVQV